MKLTSNHYLELPLLTEYNYKSESVIIRANPNSNSLAQASGILFDMLASNPFEINPTGDNSKLVSRVNMENFMQTLEIILELGELEHTGDWDPSLSIIYEEDGELLQYETEPGYYGYQILDHIESGKYYFILQDISPQDDDTEDIEYNHQVDLNSIHTIQLHR